MEPFKALLLSRSILLSGRSSLCRRSASMDRSRNKAPPLAPPPRSASPRLSRALGRYAPSFFMRRGIGRARCSVVNCRFRLRRVALPLPAAIRFAEKIIAMIRSKGIFHRRSPSRRKVLQAPAIDRSYVVRVLSARRDTRSRKRKQRAIAVLSLLKIMSINGIEIEQRLAERSRSFVLHRQACLSAGVSERTATRNLH